MAVAPEAPLRAVTDSDERFAFGANWLSFLEHLNEDRIVEAERSVQALTGLARLDNKTFIDIGSGSGLFSLAARRLGAVVHSFDYDPNSVAGTQSLKDRFFPNDTSWVVERASVLDPSYISNLGKFDIVFSWGVLHHTGAMYDAVQNASTRVSPGGIFIFALYRKTRLCGFWTAEKRWYSSASPAIQKAARAFYIGLLRLRFLLKQQDFAVYVANYKGSRGMNFTHDVHDWLGGYPYESITPAQVAKFMGELGFEHVRSTVQPYSTGLLGSGCDEYVYRRVQENLSSR